VLCFWFLLLCIVVYRVWFRYVKCEIGKSFSLFEFFFSARLWFFWQFIVLFVSEKLKKKEIY
jgi:hypothetical protein